MAAAYNAVLSGNAYRFSLAGLTQYSKLQVTWGVNASTPLGTPFITAQGDGYADIGSTVDEGQGRNIIITVTSL